MADPNIASTLLHVMKTDQEEQITTATVVAVAGGMITIKRLDSASADPTPWPSGKSAIIAPGDEVIIVRVGSGYFVLDAIQR